MATPRPSIAACTVMKIRSKVTSGCFDKLVGRPAAVSHSRQSSLLALLVCSPTLANGSKPLKCPEDLRDHVLLHTSNANSDDWRLWLTAAGLPTNLSKQPDVTFDLIFMTVQAAIDGLGVAMGRTAYVQDDIAKGRLVVPFKIALPTDAGFYLVSPAGRTDPPKLSAFRQWLIASVQNKP